MDRVINFEKVQNVRDLGGLQGSDGRLIKSGLLLRSANLAEATSADMVKLTEECRLAKVVDLRTTMEKQQKPDVMMSEAEYVEIPIFDERVFGISHEKASEDTKWQDLQVPVMEELYCMIVSEESCRKNLGKAVRVVMEHDFLKGAVLWHCTEGKDRCGLLAMLLLSALGVDRQLIMEDYLLTNEVNAPKAEYIYGEVLAAGKSRAESEAIKNVFLAKAEYLNAAFEVIDGQFGGMENYLREGLEIPEEMIVQFREKIFA